MKANRKPLIPVSAALAAALFSNAASADLHIHKKLDSESIVVIGPEVEDLSVGQQLRVETDGSVGTVTRIRGQKALVSVGARSRARRSGSSRERRELIRAQRTLAQIRGTHRLAPSVVVLDRWKSPDKLPSATRGNPKSAQSNGSRQLNVVHVLNPS